MKPPHLDLTTITQMYRVLGLPFDASKELLRQQRNKMIMMFHPDRHPSGWVDDNIPPEQRIHVVQSSFRFIMENFDAIQEHLEVIPENCLTQRANRANRSHWIYSEIESYHKK